MSSAPQRALPRRIARAAIFAAAIAGCSDHKAAPAPAKGSATTGSDDLENLLDNQPKTADHPAPPLDAAVDAEAIAVTPPVDAGVDPRLAEEAKKRKAEELRRRREAERQREADLQRQREEQLQIQQLNHIQQAKPYGAPPARRRVV